MNNAGVKLDPEKINITQAKRQLQINYFGTAYLTKKLLPLIKDNGKIVTVTSRAGLLHRLSEELQAEFLSKDITEEKINALAEAYFTSYQKEGGPKSLGYPDFMYGMSKVIINAWVRWFAGQQSVTSRQVQVYALCPGYIKTDMAPNG